MSAIADASDVDLTSPWTLAVLATALFVALAVLVFEAARRAPEVEAEPSRLDLLDGVRCHMRCGLAGTVTRVTREDLGLETVRVCPGHSDEGDHKSWWAA